MISIKVISISFPEFDITRRWIWLIKPTFGRILAFMLKGRITVRNIAMFWKHALLKRHQDKATKNNPLMPR